MNQSKQTKPHYQRTPATVWIIALLIFAGSAIGMAALLQPAAKTSGKTVTIVAGENFWGNVASQIGGNKVTVTSIISDPTADPHLYESDARDSLAITKANIVITNGLGYDDFMAKLVAAAPNSSRTSLEVANVLGVAGDNPNPHLWYDTPRIPAVAAAIEQALAAKDPADTAYFARNLATFDASLQPVLAAISQIKTKYPHAPVAYTERVPGYLLANAGLDIKTPAGFAQAIEDGNDPAPADTNIMANLMANHGMRVLLYNSQATSAATQHIRQLAVGAGIPVVGVTETLPANEPTFQAWQLAQVQAILKALGN